MKTHKGLSGGKNGPVVVLVCLCLLFGHMAFAQENLEIAKVETAGNITISSSKIIAQTQSRPGMLFDDQLAQQDIQNIATLEGVDYAYYNTQQVDGKIVLTFVVYEKNLVREIDFIGNDNISYSALLKQLTFAKGDYLDIFIAKQGAQAITEFYQKKGYPFAKVELDTQQIEYGKVIYKIDELERVRIKDLQFKGNRAIKNSQLKRGLKSKSRKLWVIPNYLNLEDLQQDIINIKKAYYEKGYANVDVNVVTDYYDDRSKVDLIFMIDEGQVFTVDEINIIGNHAIDSETITANTKLTLDWIYNKQIAQTDAEKIESMFREIGYINANVTQSTEMYPDGRVKVYFDVEQGNRFRIGKIAVTGNEETNDKVIRRVLDEYDFTPGQWYDASVATGTGRGRLEQNIQRATYAESVFITPRGDDPNYRDPLVTIAEGQTGMIMFGAGVGSNDGLVGQVVYEQRNFDITDTPDSLGGLFSGKYFKGAGQRLRISLEPGTEYSRYSLSFTEPYLNDRPIQLDTTISKFTRDRDDYDEDRLGGFVTFTKRFENGWSRGLGIRLEQVTLEDIDPDAPKTIFDYEDSTFLAGFKIFTGKSTVDNRYNPTRGYNFLFEVEPVVGDENFGIISVTNRWYKTLYEDIAERKTVLETKVFGAAIAGDAPPFEKFYAGGIGSIRGFEYRGISTREDSIDPASNERGKVGSDWIVTGTTQVAIPLGQGETIAALFFADAGMIDSGGVRAAVGTGLQIMIPQVFGPVPMRFELAIPVMEDDEDETQVFSFSIGRLF